MTNATRASRKPRPTRGPIIVVGVVGLVIMVAVLAISLLSSGTDPSAAASDPATPSASASALPRPSATSGASSATDPSPSMETAAPTPTASVDQAAALGLPEGLLPAGSVVTVTGDGIRIREEPSTNATILATAIAGDAIHVRDVISAGPVSAEGYDWYQVEYAGGPDIWPWQDLVPPEATEYTTGWMAAGSASERFVRLAEVACPTEPITLSVLAFELTAWARLVCLRDSPTTVEGTFGCDACGGVTPGASPTWLADSSQHAPIAGQYRYYPFIRVAVPPDLAPPADRDIVRATLHVDDRAAADCSYAPDPGSSPAPLAVDPAAVEIFCRERLVLEAFEVTGTDDFGR